MTLSSSIYCAISRPCKLNLVPGRGGRAWLTFAYWNTSGGHQLLISISQQTNPLGFCWDGSHFASKPGPVIAKAKETFIVQYTRAITDDPIIRIYSKGELCPTSSVFPVPRRVCQKPGCRPSYIYCFTCSCTDIMTCSQLSALNISKWVAIAVDEMCVAIDLVSEETCSRSEECGNQ